MGRMSAVAGALALGLSLTGAAAGAAGAGAAAGAAEPVPTPPYLAYGARNLIVGFEVDAAALRALLPPGLEPASDVVHLNMYEVPAALGVPPYTRSYVWADVQGFDAWDGTPGRYVLVGWADPEGFREVAREQLHWPAEAGRTSLREGPGGELVATLEVGGRALVEARARPGAGPGEPAPAMLPYLFVDAAVAASGAAVTPAEVGVNRVAFAGRVTPAEPLGVRFDPPDAGHPLAGLRPRRLVDAALVRDGAFVLGVVEPPPAGP